MSSAAISTFTPEQVRQRKIIKRGLNLTVLVCGKSGTGKSTFINSLCDQEIFGSTGATSSASSSNLTIENYKIDVNELNSTPISLRVVLTPGFGDSIDNSECSNTILEYLEEQFDEILQEECRIKRNPRSSDNRVHVALYFIRPTGRGLTEIDMGVMKVIGSRVNVIPILSKADTLTEDEMILNKQLIMRQIKENEIPIFDFAPHFEEYDDDDIAELLQLKGMLPFAISGSDNKCSAGPRVRDYPWGTFTIEDPGYCDFIALKTVLFGSHLQEFKEYTHNVLYERYRTDRLSGRDRESQKKKERSLAGEQLTRSKERQIEVYDERLGSYMMDI